VTRALVVSPPAAELELAVDVLFSVGVAAVEERDGELWTHVGDADGAIAAAVERFPATWRWRTVDVDPAVGETWRRFAEPVSVDERLRIVPPWRDDIPAAAPGQRSLAIDPGGAFGAGDHPTTLLTLRRYLRLVDAGDVAVGHDVVDVGSGSGVLAIAAALHGARRVEAIDIHGAAVEATAANAARNGVADVVVASATPVGDVVGEFDVVFANLLAPILRDLAAPLAARVAAGGWLLLSGVLAGGCESVLAALAAVDNELGVVDVTTLDGWAVVAVRRPAS